MTYISQKWLDVLAPFTGNYAQRLTGSTIAAGVHMPQKTVSRILDSLGSKRIIQYSMDGKNKYYYFDLHDNMSTVVLSMTEHSKALWILMNYPHLRTMLVELMEYGTVVLFGSYAKSMQHEESDVDLWVVARKKNLQRIVEKYPYEVHLQFSTLDEFSRKLANGHHLAVEIARHHVVFGNADGIVGELVRYWRVKP